MSRRMLRLALNLVAAAASVVTLGALASVPVAAMACLVALACVVVWHLGELGRSVARLWSSVEQLQNEWIKAGPSAGEVESLREEAEQLRTSVRELIEERALIVKARGAAWEAAAKNEAAAIKFVHVEAAMSKAPDAELSAAALEWRYRLATFVHGLPVEVPPSREELEEESLTPCRSCGGEHYTKSCPYKFEAVPPPRKKRTRKPKAGAEAEVIVDHNGRKVEPQRTDLMDAIGGAHE
jgi:Eukaryotic translation initiation factor 3 subunit G